MPQKIRNYLLKIALWVGFGAMTAVCVLWGETGFVDLKIRGLQPAATVNGETISVKDAKAQWRRTELMWRQRFGGELPAQLKESMQDQTLEALVRDELLHRHAHRLGYRVSDESLYEQIRENPQFQVKGMYSPEAARRVLGAAGLSEKEFDVSLRRDVERRQIEGALEVSNFLTPAESTRMQALQRRQDTAHPGNTPGAAPSAEASQWDLMQRMGEGDAIAYVDELRRTASVSKNPRAFQ